jgi:hypothetical protein
MEADDNDHTQTWTANAEAIETAGRRGSAAPFGI